MTDCSYEKTDIKIFVHVMDAVKNSYIKIVFILANDINIDVIVLSGFSVLKEFTSLLDSMQSR